MKRRLIIHIGAHRTATSSLQEYLFRNFEKLMEVGFFLPLRQRRHVTMMSRIFNGEVKAADVGRTLDELADSKPDDIHTLILSDEDICMRPDLSLLKGFQDTFDVKVYFSLRRQDLWLESWYFQNIKWQWNPSLAHCSFDEFLAQRKDFFWINYDATVRHLEKTFGAENVILSVFEKSQMPDGPIDAFCTKIGMTNREKFQDVPAINASRSPMLSEFMRQLPLDAAALPVRAKLTRALETVDAEVFGNIEARSERLLPPDARQAILAEYEKSNMALAQRYFSRDALFLEPLPAEDMPLAQLELPQDVTTLMEQLVSPFVAALIEQENAAVLAKQSNTA